MTCAKCQAEIPSIRALLAAKGEALVCEKCRHQPEFSGYQIQGEIARGGMGVVFLARDPRSAKDVAIKLILANRGHSMRRFQREIEAVTRLRHPNIVTALDSGTRDEHPYLVMEYVEGPTLDEVLLRGPLQPEEAIRITRRLAQALQHAHDNNVLHRDVKPSNVIMDTTGEPRLTDFGISRALSRSGTQITEEGQSLGTPGYWAPEQAKGRLDLIGPHTDVYSLGATFYALLTGFPPHNPNTHLEAMRQVDKDPYPPSVAWPEVDEALDPICLRCLAKRPEDRYASAGEVDAALARYQESQGQRATDPALAEQVRPQPQEPPPPQQPQQAEPSARAGTPAQSRLTGSHKQAFLLLVGAVLIVAVSMTLGGIFMSSYLAAAPTQEDPSARAEARLHQQDYLGAIEDYTQAIGLEEQEAERVPLYLGRAHARAKLLQVEGALTDLALVLAIDPNLARAHYLHGQVRTTQGHYEGAIDDYTLARQLVSDEPELAAEIDAALAEARRSLPRRRASAR